MEEIKIETFTEKDGTQLIFITYPDERRWRVTCEKSHKLTIVGESDTLKLLKYDGVYLKITQ